MGMWLARDYESDGCTRIMFTRWAWAELRAELHVMERKI